MSDDIVDQALSDHLLADMLSPVVQDIARLVADKVHATIKMHAMSLPNTGMAAAMGVLAAHQILAETITFAMNSMDGDDGDKQAIRASLNSLFDQLRTRHRLTPSP